jgi:hypothetical protein
VRNGILLEAPGKERERRGAVGGSLGGGVLFFFFFYLERGLLFGFPSAGGQKRRFVVVNSACNWRERGG